MRLPLQKVAGAMRPMQVLALLGAALGIVGAIASGAIWLFSSVYSSGQEKTTGQMLIQKLSENVEKEAEERQSQDKRIIDLMLEARKEQKEILRLQAEALVRDTESKQDRVHLQQAVEATSKRIDTNVETVTKAFDKIDAKLDELRKK